MSPSLDRLRIATPCPIKWEQMTGDDRVRFCGHCQLNVYNISALTKGEAQALLVATEGRLCARLYRRSDGTVITKDCPVGLKALRRKVSQTAAAVFALISSLTSVASGQSGSSQKSSCIPQTRITQRDAGSSSEKSTVTGQVFDPLGAVVPYAKILLLNPYTKEVQQTESNEKGNFQFGGLPQGKYSLRIESAGFLKYQLKDLQLKENRTTNIQVTLLIDSESVVLGGLVSQPLNDLPGTTTITEKLFRSLPH